ncbi:MAG: hypothetical protein WBR56_12235, partial [Sedimenticolaceae bacterium]
MISSLFSSPGSLLLVGPGLMLLIAAVPAGVATRRPLAMGRLIQAVALASLLCTLGVALEAILGEATTPATLVVLGSDTGGIPLALSVLADSLTFTLLGLVSLIAAIIARYSTNYLDGEPTQGRFFRSLALTVSAFMLVVIAGNMLMFALAIVLTGTGLNRLLTHYRGRLPAQMVAHKKLLF